MEMDIPDADELQWLESNSHYYDFPEDDDEFGLQPEPELEQPPPNLQLDTSIPSSVISSDAASNKKRPPSPEEFTISSDDEPSDPKRSRSDLPVTADESDDDLDLLMEFGLSSGNVDVSGTGKEEVEEKYLSRFASEIEGDCVPVTAPCGERVYAKIDMVEGVDQVKSVRVSAESGGLISESIDTLLQRLEQQSLLKALQDSSETQHDTLMQDELVSTEQLWVEKYAPNSFTELLSDEHTNREVLLWLKQWDSTVFGVDIRNTSEEVLSALRRHSTISHHPKRSDTNFARNNRDFRSFVGNQENIRPLGDQGAQLKKLRNGEPPDQKVLLLCGPPGLGKTTLAHVAARHCGYHVVEINASDDRSASTIETKILDAVQMNSVMADAKPKCLVIDEIDGALGDGKGAIEVILKMIAADRNSESSKAVSAKEQPFERKSSKKGRKAVSLSRPIICICNDLYVPALRSLRQVAKVHTFTLPTLNRVVSRLKYICNKEEMKTSSIALTELARYTECDIRSCLNTLQFLNKKKTSLNVVEISSQVIGRKDMAKSVFDIWSEVFQKRKVKANRKPNSCRTNTFDAPDSLYSLISHRGDYELVFDGIHENILQQHYHDPGMLKTVQCLDSLGTSDLLNQRIMSTHNMTFYLYLPPLAITIHRLVSQVGRPIFEWPRSFHRYRTSLMGKIETLRSWQCKMTPTISRHMSIRTFIEDTSSFLLHILSPPTLRPAALHLHSDAERNSLFQLVSSMVTYSITYKNTKTESLTSDPRQGMVDVQLLSLDPPIQVFVRFKGYDPQHHELTSAVKQVLIHEVEKQKILRGSNNRSESNDDTDGLGTEKNGMCTTSESANKRSIFGNADRSIEQAKKKSQTIESESGICKGPLPVVSDTSSPVIKQKALGVSKKGPTGSFDFFSRFKKSGNGSQNGDSPAQKPAATLERDRRPVLFKFNEGYTNAVKRPVRIRDLLL